LLPDQAPPIAEYDFTKLVIACYIYK
jgi:hypothetical protein